MGIKNKTYLAGIMAGLLLLSGCNPMSREVVQEDGWAEVLDELKTGTPDQIESHITADVSESLTIDADISGIDGLNAYELENIKMERHLFKSNKEEILQLVLEEMPIVNPTEPAERQTDYYLENGEEEISLGVDSEEEVGFVQVRDSYMVGTTEEYWQLYEGLNAFDVYTYKGYRELSDPALAGHFGELESDRDLEFLSLEEAEQYLVEFLKKTGVEMDCNIKIFSASEEVLQKIAEEEEADLSFQKENEAYWILFPQSYKGVPFISATVPASVSNSSYGVHQDNYLLLTEKGILDFGVRNVFDIDGTESPQPIISVGEVLEKVVQRHEQTAKENVKERVVEVELCYLPVWDGGTSMSFTAKPVWYVRSVVIEDNWEGVSETIYDAVTGDEISWDE